MHMPDIKKPINFNNLQTQIINQKLSNKNFIHNQWSEDDLLELRCAIRDYYRKKQNGRCAYCKKDISLVSPLNCHVEHIVPKSLHLEFIFIPENLCTICADCNQIKKNQETLAEIQDTLLKQSNNKKYPKNSKSFKIVHPHFDNYDEHIKIFNGSYYMSHTLKGNFTIGACNLNRKMEKFGWEKEIYSEDALIELMDDFKKNKDSINRFKALTKFKEMLFVL